MKVLFAVSNENISSAIIKKYQKEYREILSYKNVYYFNAILKEIQKDKSYDRIIIGEDLEPFVNKNNDSIDNFIFDHLDKISDEAQVSGGKECSIILICSERRTPGSNILNKLFSIGVYNALLGGDRTIQEICKLINKPRTKKEAKIYYRIDQATYDPAMETGEVNEVEIQNILSHFRKLGKNTDRYADSFNNIAAQYTDEQLKIIINVLPIKVKAVLELESPKYQSLMGTDANVNNSKKTEVEPGIRVNTIGKSAGVNGPIVIPSGVRRHVINSNKVNSNAVSASNNTTTNVTSNNVQQPVSEKKNVVSHTNKNIVKVQRANINVNNAVNKTVKVQQQASSNFDTIRKVATTTNDKIESKKSTDVLLNDLVNNNSVKEENGEIIQEKRGRGRPKKIVTEPVKPKGKRGRPRKVQNIDDSFIDNGNTEEILPGLDISGNEALSGIDNSQSDLLPGLDGSEEDLLSGLDSNEEDLLPGLDDDEKDLLPGLDENEEDLLPGLDGSEEDLLPGLDENEEDLLPGLDGSEEDLLPGLDENEEDLLPGLDENEEDLLSGLDGNEEDLLPGLDENEEDSLPGLDGSEEDLLSGLDSNGEDSLPGLDENEGEEVDVSSLFAGLDDDDISPSKVTTNISEEDNSISDLDDNNLLLEDNGTSETLLPGMGFDNSINNTIKSYSIPQNNNSIDSIKPKVDYSMSNLNSLLSKDKKIVTFVGTSKNGTSFIVNNLAEMFSLMGIDTAILDMTKNRNSYYMFTDSRRDLMEIAHTCISKLEEGYAEGVKVNKNLTVYTALPSDDSIYENAEPILSTLVQNHSLILIDCDFQTDASYFANAQEIYLVQSMDVLTIQPLTEFLRELKYKGAWEPEKARVVINKEIGIKHLTNDMIIGGMSRYNGPDMSVMTDLFNKDMIKKCSIPFDEKVYSKYLDTIATCKLSLNNYPKQFVAKLQILGDMVYPRLNVRKSYDPTSRSKSSYNGGSNVFSNNTNNTLNAMKNKY